MYVAQVTMNSPGQRMSYPYSAMGKFLHFPWKHYWKGRGFRFAVYGTAVAYLLFFKLHGAGEDTFLYYTNKKYLHNV